MKASILMEGGGLRSMFTCGVIDVLMENGIHFDGAAGISAGACFGCNLKSGQIGRGIRYNMAYIRDKRYLSLRNLIFTGNLFRTDFVYDELPRKLDVFDCKSFEENPMEFYCGAANIETGKICYHKVKDGGDRDMLWFRASASLPLVARPVEIDGKLYLDGGIIEPVPLRFMEKKGYDRNLIVLTQPESFRKGPTGNRLLLKLSLRRFPEAFKAMLLRPKRYNETIDYCRRREQEGSALILCPPEVLPAHRLTRDPGKLWETYEIGRRTAEEMLPRIRAFLYDGTEEKIDPIP